MVFGVAVLNRPIVAAVAKKHYDKVLDLIDRELILEKVKNTHIYLLITSYIIFNIYSENY